MAKEKLNFVGLDTDAFSGKVKQAWETYLKVRKPVIEEMAKLNAKIEPQRTAVENAVTDQLRRDGVLKPGQDVKFGYRFGGMSIAMIDAAAGKTSKKLVLGSGK